MCLPLAEACSLTANHTEPRSLSHRRRHMSRGTRTTLNRQAIFALRSHKVDVLQTAVTVL